MVESLAEQTDLFGTGDMGIANTTPSTAVRGRALRRPVADVTGRGTGIDDGQLARKIAVGRSRAGRQSSRSARRAGRAVQGGRIRDRRHWPA